MGNEEKIAIAGWLIDCIVAMILYILIGYLISLKYKSKRKIIITISVLLALVSPTHNLYANLQNNQETTQSKSTKIVHKEATQQAKLSTKELQNLFNKVISDSEGGILDISYTCQGDTIEVDVKVLEESWKFLDSKDKNTMVAELGKGFELAVKESSLYIPGNNVYVYYYGDTSSDELAHYDNNQVNQVTITKETPKSAETTEQNQSTQPSVTQPAIEDSSNIEQATKETFFSIFTCSGKKKPCH
ncbi:MAG: hypothetical protein ACQEWV_26065 [Bacillota bacterium]